MSAKDELSQYKFKAKRVQEALEEYEKYLDRATKVTAMMDENPAKTNMNSDKVGNNAAIMADLNNEYKERWVEAERRRLELVDNINKLKEPYRTILIERYIHDKNFENIAVELGYSYDRTIHLHGEALQEFDKIPKVSIW